MAANPYESTTLPLLGYATFGVTAGVLGVLLVGPLLALPVAFAAGAVASALRYSWRWGIHTTGCALLAATGAGLPEATLGLALALGLSVTLVAAWFVRDLEESGGNDTNRGRADVRPAPGERTRPVRPRVAPNHQR